MPMLLRKLEPLAVLPEQTFPATSEIGLGISVTAEIVLYCSKVGLDISYC